MNQNRYDVDYLTVTQILSEFSGVHRIDPEILQKAADRGTIVHQICGAIINGIGCPSVNPAYKGYIESFKKWWNPEFKVIAQEERFYCDKHMFSGQVDLIIDMGNGLPVIVDFKTSASNQKSWPLQLAAYWYLCGLTCEIHSTASIRLNKDGSFPEIMVYEFEDICDYKDRFFRCYELYKYFFMES